MFFFASENPKFILKRRLLRVVVLNKLFDLLAASCNISSLNLPIRTDSVLCTVKEIEKKILHGCLFDRVDVCVAVWMHA